MDRQNTSGKNSSACCIGHARGCICPTGHCYETVGMNAKGRPRLLDGPWAPTPWWMFWKPALCRKTWLLDGHREMWMPVYEYQHPAFAAREALEQRFGGENNV